MAWQTEWNAISGRIAGIVEAGRFYVECTSVRTTDDFGAAKGHLLPQALEIFKELKGFHARNAGTLPQVAASSLTRFLSEADKKFSGDMDAHSAVQYRLTALAAFRSEFGFHVSDFSAVARRLSERAFVHLCRSIVADSEMRRRWCEAYKSGEPACERLGAVHLLLHGIWAFKVNAAGEHTDLVFGERPSVDEAERTVDAIVLTEWKIARGDSEVELKLEEARKQAALYSAGALGGLELAGYRYLVVVTEKRARDFPADVHDGEIVYRHINVVVSPDPPSREVRR